MKILPNSLMQNTRPSQQVESKNNSENETKSDSETENRQSVQRTPNQSPGANQASKAEKVAEEFESMFLDLMLKSMRKTATSENESNAESIYKSMLDTEYSKTMSQSYTFGIKELIMDWMNKQHPEATTETFNSSESQTKGPESSAQIDEALNRPSSLNIPELHSRMAMDIYQQQLKLGQSNPSRK